MNRPDKPESTLADKVTQGTAWTLSFRIVDRVIGMASTLILVRLLSPADFGIVAMAMTIIALLEVFTLAEFSSAIIQHPSPSRDYYDSAWTLSFVFGAFSTLLMLLFAKPIAGFFNEPQLAPVIVALSLIPLVDGLFNMGCVDFRKYLQFRKDFIFMTGRKLTGVIAVIPLAFIFRSYWALVGGMIAGRLAGLILSYLLHPFRPQFSFGSAAPLFRFSRWIILNNALTFLSTRGAHLIIGRVSGATTLGTYTVAHEMASLPTTELAAPINRVMFPAYSTLSHDLSALRHGFLKVLGLIALLAIPAGLGMASVAHLFVPVVLGDKWHGRHTRHRDSGRGRRHLCPAGKHRVVVLLAGKAALQSGRDTGGGMPVPAAGILSAATLRPRRRSQCVSCLRKHHRACQLLVRHAADRTACKPGIGRPLAAAGGWSHHGTRRLAGFSSK